jgi:hypothetical protein
MPLFIPIPVADLAQEIEQPSRTYRLDLDRGRILRAGSCDGLDAANQYIRKALISPRFQCLIYDNQYGSEIKQRIITDDATPEFIETELPRLVRDALLVDSRILGVFGFSFSFDAENVFINFSANTIFGTTEVEVIL